MSEFNQVLQRILKKHLSCHVSTDVVENIEFELCSEFAGEKVYISQPFEIRNRRIVDMAKTGHHILAIAQYYDLTEKSVKQIIKNWSCDQ